MIKLKDSQKKAVDSLRSGSILNGGVGSGKSIASLAFYFLKICFGDEQFTCVGMAIPLYIITTAKKRDSLEWDRECAKFALSQHIDATLCPVVIDSWNNIGKYANVTDSFFIFDEQRVVGKGAWVKFFLRITRRNQWILLTATPGDTWEDYIPVFIANGFFRNRTEFYEDHVIFDRFTKYPKILKYINTDYLDILRKKVLVQMDRERKIEKRSIEVLCDFDQGTYKDVCRRRKDPVTGVPFQQANTLCYCLRRLTNDSRARIRQIERILMDHPKLIIFYNFDYELVLLKMIKEDMKEIRDIGVSEYNGHHHEDILKNYNSWVYLVQYNSGAEGWNCTETDTMIFFSLSYSYRMMEQAAGRIDRMNSPYDILWYYYLTSKSGIDYAIKETLKNKATFNEREFAGKISVEG